MATFKRFLVGLPLLGVLALAGCGGATDSDDPFLVSPGKLAFEAQIGGSAPAPKSVTITANKSDAAVPTYEGSGAAVDSVVWWSDTSKEIELRVSAPDPDEVGVGTHSGTVTISSSEHTETVSVTYTVTGSDPVVSSVSPYVAMANEAGTVVIAGGGFTSIAGTPTVLFGDVPGVSAQVVSDSEIRVHRPALAAGSYDVTISGSTSFPSSATVKVIDPPAYTAYSLASWSAKSKVVEYAEGSAFFIADIAAQKVERYTHSGTGWTVDSVSVSGVQDIALQPGGSRLLAVGGASVYAIDPSAATMTASVLATADLDTYSTCGYRFGTIEFTSTGRALAIVHAPYCSGGLQAYVLDTASDSLTELTGFWLSTSVLGEEPVAGTSATGQILLTDGDWVSEFDGFDLDLSMTDMPAAEKIAMDADGSVTVTEKEVYTGGEFVYTYEVYDESFTSLGTITPATVFEAIAVSPDGSRLYGYDSSGATVTVYDLTTSDGAGGFQQVGTPAVLATDPGYDSSYPSTFIVSADGQALIFAGTDNVVVVPVSSL